jgi:hypothetical protein
LLSYPTDRLPAVAAIAQALQPFLADYTAGLWNAVLHLELLWKPGRTKIAPRPAEYISPTWSWPSINCAIHRTEPLFKADPTDKRHEDPSYDKFTDPRSEHYDPDVDDRRYHWFPQKHERFKILSCTATTEDPTFAFGAILPSPRAKLVVEGLARTAIWHPFTENRDDTTQLAALKNPADGHYVPAKFHVDCVPSGAWDGGPTEVVLVLITGECDESWYGLVLRPRPGDEEDVFERLGMFHMHWGCGFRGFVKNWGYGLYVQEAQWVLTGDVQKFIIV